MQIVETVIYHCSRSQVDLMIDEARRIKMLDQHYTDDYTTEFSFEDFVKLFSNHYYRVSESELEDAFRYLGFEENDDPYICKSDFVYFLTNEGEVNLVHVLKIFGMRRQKTQGFFLFQEKK